MLCGCSKPITFEDVEPVYIGTESYAKENVKKYDELFKEDYLSYVDYISENYEKAQYSSKQEDPGSTLINLYAQAVELKYLIEDKGSDYNGLFKNLVDKTIVLVKAAYESDEAVASAKADVMNAIEAIGSIDDETWKTLEVRNYISWNETIEEEYAYIDDHYTDDMIPNKQVLESDLEKLKNIIIDGYEIIKDGIVKENHKTAKEMYDAASKLRRYTKYINGTSPDKVYYFAKYTQDYIKTRYIGFETELEGKYDYEEEINSARKYTQSILNEICILLKQ